MAYYDVLKAAWNGTTQPPAGVTGTALTGAMTTAQKLAAVNAWTVAAPAIPMIIPSYKIYNEVVPSEFTALTAANQQLIRDIFGMGAVDASPGTNIRNVIVSIFPSTTQTFKNLAVLAATYDTQSQSWCAANGYPHSAMAGALSTNDTTAAGLV